MEIILSYLTFCCLLGKSFKILHVKYLAKHVVDGKCAKNINSCYCNIFKETSLGVCLGPLERTSQKGKIAFEMML